MKNFYKLAGLKPAALLMTLGLTLGLAAPAANASSVAPTLPVTTNYTNSGLVEMLRVTGRLFVSLDGFATNSPSVGQIQVEKPSNDAKVVGAYLTVANTWGDTQNNDGVFKLNGQTITFSHKASNASSTNYLADVTTVVKGLVDAAGAGLIDISVEEGANYLMIDGSSLMVIFDDPQSGWGSVIFMFGTADPNGDKFGASFPALGSTELTGHWMSLGISFSCQPNNLNQRSELSITTSANATPVFISKAAGGSDEAGCVDSSLVTVGGIGDSRSANPGEAATFTVAEKTDDELYTLDPYLVQGDTAVTLQSVNPSLDDNIFQAVFFLNRVQVAGATVVDDPSVSAIVGAPNIANIPSPPSAPAPVPEVVREFVFPLIDSVIHPKKDAARSAAAFLPGETAKIHGQRLGQLSSVKVGGVPATFADNTEFGFTLTLPNLQPGTYDLVVTGPLGTLTYLSSIRVAVKIQATQVELDSAPNSSFTTKSFSGFAPGSAKLSLKSTRELARWIKSLDGVARIDIRGFTMGPTVKKSDRALGIARAKVASSELSRLIDPQVKVNILGPGNETRLGDSIRRVEVTVYFQK